MATEFLSRTEWITTAEPDSLEFARMLVLARNLEERGLNMRVALVVSAESVTSGTPPGGPGQPGSTHLYSREEGSTRHRGARPGLIEEEIDRQRGNVRKAIENLANARGDVEVRGVTRVQMHIWMEGK